MADKCEFGENDLSYSFDHKTSDLHWSSSLHIGKTNFKLPVQCSVKYCKALQYL